LGNADFEDDIVRAFGNPDLLVAAYASSSWNKILSAKNCFDKFEAESEEKFSWPLDQMVIKNFIEWAVFVKKMTASTVESYLHCIGIIHRLKNCDGSACTSKVTKLLIRGAENLEFYKPPKKLERRVMTLPLLRLIGHEIKKCDWSRNSKLVTWAALCVGFFGSFRFGEILSKHEDMYNPHETLLWRDIIFLNDDSVKILNKIPKTRKKDGEVVSLFEFNYFGCCPINALKSLKKSTAKSEDDPVFKFDNGTYLTCKNLNKLIQMFLSKHIGEEAKFYYCHSFRGALPSALAAIPDMDNDPSIMKWGRWNSEAFEKYVRLSHVAKRELFNKFILALNCKLK
jgi:hypothetical protein